ncbi:MATE family efflux transporter [Paenibacillus sp. FSL R7-0273]|uniref:MATE family efflux transporter n=1 Tax=Paenibacillus sp. FSL R7-0273 TaxID=1536772 RepID=UPI00063F92F8|nr:MATE family efflux transporter [Paenibacillus sp. FSL R7-0273]OMF95992.1 hypothetical protein BK144_05280 [Paenibacillus sp. FSL R7-0273]
MDASQTKKLTKDPISRLLLSFCSQTTMSVMLYSFQALINTYFVAVGVGAYAAGAVALSAPIMLIIGSFASTVGAGGASIVSRALGKNDPEKAASTVGNTLLFFWMISSVSSVLGLLLLNPLLELLAVDDVLMPYAKGYTEIILIGAVTATGFSSLIRAEGNIRFSIYQWTVSALVNLLLDPLFIFYFHMGVEGAALATVISQMVSMGLCMYYYFLSKKHAFPVNRRHFRVKPALMGEILSIGSPALLSQIGNSIFLIAINHRLGALGGPEAISAFGIVSRLRSFLVMPVSGIVQGLQPIIGFNYAAGLNKRVQEAIRLSILATILYGLVIMLICILIPRELIYIFIREEQIVSIGIRALQSIALSFPFMGALTITAAYFQSTGKALFAFALPMMSIVLISVPALYILSWIFELRGIWFTYLVSDGITFLMAIFFLQLILKRQNANTKERI